MVPILDCLSVKTLDGVHYKSSFPFKAHYSMQLPPNIKTNKLLSKTNFSPNFITYFH